MTTPPSSVHPEAHLYGHDCSTPPAQAEPSGAAKREHQRRRTPPCRYAQASAAFYYWTISNPHLPAGGWPGWKPRTDRRSPSRPYLHDCGTTGPPIPSTGPYREHQHRRTPACRWSKSCRALHQRRRRRLRRSPHPDHHDCASTDVTPTEGPYLAHRRRGTPACVYALDCAALKAWQRKYPDRPPEDRTPRRRTARTGAPAPA